MYWQLLTFFNIETLQIDQVSHQDSQEYLRSTVNIMEMQLARASAGTMLIWFSQDIPDTTWSGLTSLTSFAMQSARASASTMLLWFSQNITDTSWSGLTPLDPLNTRKDKSPNIIQMNILKLTSLHQTLEFAVVSNQPPANATSHRQIRTVSWKILQKSATKINKLTEMLGLCSNVPKLYNIHIQNHIIDMYPHK